MDAIDLIRRIHQHRLWVNGNLLSAAAALNWEQLSAPFPIGQGSIWKSLVHMYAAEYVWLETLRGSEDPLLPGDIRGKLPGNQLGTGGLTGFEDLREKWASLDRRWTDYLATLTPEALDDTVYKVSSSVGQGKRFGSRRSDILLHVATHAHYTAAQVINMLRQSGVAPLPETMLISLARRETVD